MIIPVVIQHISHLHIHISHLHIYFLVILFYTIKNTIKTNSNVNKNLKVIKENMDFQKLVEHQFIALIKFTNKGSYKKV